MSEIKIVWFRNDLRVEDHPALWEACHSSDYVLPIYILNPNDFIIRDIGFPKIGLHRKHFIMECLLSLNEELKKLGSKLIVLQGEPTEVLINLANDLKINNIYSTVEFAYDEKNIESQVSKHLPLKLFTGSTLYDELDLPFTIEKIPKHFTPFKEKIEKKGIIRKLFPKPDKIPGLPPGINLKSILDEISTKNYNIIFRGGISAATKRIEIYFFESHSLSNYKSTRNEIMGENTSSRLSPYLSQGCLSPVMVYDWILKYENEVHKNESTYWLFFELLWREYFKWVAVQKSKQFFFKNGWSLERKDFSNDKKIYHSWILAQTSEPLINAFMKELYFTGFMSNRGRQIAASYFSKDLEMDWRLGAGWFESCLIDYDVCSNYGNWSYQAGVGNDPRSDRRFNLNIQRENYDPDGKFIKQWENSKIPDFFSYDKTHTNYSDLFK